MKTRNIYKSIALMVVALTTAACQNELNEDTNQPKPGEKVTMTIHATQVDATHTRTTYDDQLDAQDINKVLVKWEGGTEPTLGNDVVTVEEIAVFGYANNAAGFTEDNYKPFESVPKTLSLDGSSIDFTEAEPDYPNLTGPNYVAIYPAWLARLQDNGSLLFKLTGQTQDCTLDYEMAHLKEKDIMLGTPATTGSHNYSFTHQTIMLRFKLNMPTAESVTGVTLATSNQGIASTMSAKIDDTNVKLIPNLDAKSLSLAVTNHTANTELKAYMMVGGIDTSNGATLTVTVNTASGNTYTGNLDVAVGTTLTAGKCYTLTPDLKLSNTISLPTIAYGKLGTILANVNPAPGQTELVLKGDIGDNSKALRDFLQSDKGNNITTLDLSGLNYQFEVSGLMNCKNLVKVILPNGITRIGMQAFKGCTALKVLTQKGSANTVSTHTCIPSGVVAIGSNAFEGCTALTEMFLHSEISLVEKEAFKDCTNLNALVFEGTKAVGNGGIKLETDILSGSTKAAILLPNIKAEATAQSYKDNLSNNTFYSYDGIYEIATVEDRLFSTNYTSLSTNSSN